MAHRSLPVEAMAESDNTATRRKRSRARLVFTAAIPPLMYPLLMLTLLVQDWVVGDREFLDHVFYEPRQFIVSFLADWTLALPWLYGITLPLWLGARALLGRLGAYRPWSLALAGGLAGAILAGWLAEAVLVPTVLSFAVNGALAGVALGVAGPLVRKRET